MGKKMTIGAIITRAVLISAASITLFACAAEEGSNVPNPVAAAPQPAETALQPGLAVKYWYNDVDNIGAMERLTRQVQGQPGAALKQINFPEARGNVMTSSARVLVGAEITGYIRFPQTGRYQVATNSNDGVRVYVGGKRVIEDPDAHPMTQAIGEISVEGGAWYPLKIIYFQRQGSWGLELLSAPVGQPLSMVPETALFQAK
jgi:hypothetical protein